MNYKMLKFPLVMLCPFLMTSCGGGGYKVAIPDTNGVTISPNTAKKGEDYVGVISIVKEMTDLLLPDTLTKVTSGNKELSVDDGYTYEVKDDHLSADFKVPSANIIGDISIQLDLVDDKINSQEELMSALKFEGTDYVQVSWNAPKKAIKCFEEYSPTVYHYVLTKSSSTQEYYYSKEGEEVYEYKKNPSGKWEKESGHENDFIEVNELYEEYDFDLLVNEGLSYDTLKYDKGQYTWECYKNERVLQGIENLKFSNKKLTYYQTIINNEGTMEEDEHGDITYKKYTPKLPEVDPAK